MVDFDKLRM